MKVGIIGGGPGGAVTAATLVRLGHEAHIYESEVFPRFHIGESLLPCNMPIYEDLGISREAFRQQSYQPKTAAHFEHVASGRTVRFPFADGLAGDPASIFQVERSRFDKLLLDTAIANGAILHCPATVASVDLERLAIVHDRGADAYDFIVDASGRETLLGRQLGIVDRDGDLMRAAVFGHIADLPLAPGAEIGDISIAKADEGWCWQIPLEPRKWSIGLVLKRERVIKGGTPADVFRNNLAFFPQVRERLGGQVPDPTRSIPNISYRVRERIGPGYALLGDAGGFIDPIFSSGVLLATRAGWRLGRALHAGGPRMDLGAWKAETDHDLSTFVAFIKLWYDGHFVDNLFFAERRDPPIYQGIISLLAGNTTHPDNAFLALLKKRMARQNARTVGTSDVRRPTSDVKQPTTDIGQ
ncbi:MAG: tryptophan 7-halogenase [Planctomycetes bacterium]|nr:tryptophan 7-halogenase [Planctomycetota bacterium]